MQFPYSFRAHTVVATLLFVAGAALFARETETSLEVSKFRKDVYVSDLDLGTAVTVSVLAADASTLDEFDASNFEIVPVYENDEAVKEQPPAEHGDGLITLEEPNQKKRHDTIELHFSFQPGENPKGVVGYHVNIKPPRTSLGKNINYVYAIYHYAEDCDYVRLRGVEGSFTCSVWKNYSDVYQYLISGFLVTPGHGWNAYPGGQTLKIKIEYNGNYDIRYVIWRDDKVKAYSYSGTSPAQ